MTRVLTYLAWISPENPNDIRAELFPVRQMREVLCHGTSLMVSNLGTSNMANKSWSHERSQHITACNTLELTCVYWVGTVRVGMDLEFLEGWEAEVVRVVDRVVPFQAKATLLTRWTV